MAFARMPKFNFVDKSGCQQSEAELVCAVLVGGHFLGGFHLFGLVISLGKISVFGQTVGSTSRAKNSLDKRFSLALLREGAIC